MRGERDVSFFWVVPHRYPCVSLPTSSPLGSEVRQRVHLPITSISASLLWTLALCGLFTSRVLTVVQKLSLAGEVRRGNMNWCRYRERKKSKKEEWWGVFGPWSLSQTGLQEINSNHCSMTENPLSRQP